MTRRVRPDRGLVIRMLVVMVLLVGLYAGFIAVMAYFGIPWNYSLIFGVGVTWVLWFFSASLAMSATKAEEVTPEQAPELHAMVDRLCAMADMPKPRLAIARTDVPNAFATGRSPKRSVVCVTTGLTRRLNVREVEAVLAHELAHVAHRDIAVFTIASTFGLIAGWFARNVLYEFFRGRGEMRGNGGLVDLFFYLFFLLAVIIGIVVTTTVQVISHFLVATLSRYRELGADRGAAVLTGQPLVLANALRKVSGSMAAIPDEDLREVQAYNAFMFASALSEESLAAVFPSHPSLERRLEQLNRIALELGECNDNSLTR